MQRSCLLGTCSPQRSRQGPLCGRQQRRRNRTRRQGPYAAAPPCLLWAAAERRRHRPLCTSTPVGHCFESGWVETDRLETYFCPTLPVLEQGVDSLQVVQVSLLHLKTGVYFGTVGNKPPFCLFLFVCDPLLRPGTTFFNSTLLGKDTNACTEIGGGKPGTQRKAEQRTHHLSVCHDCQIEVKTTSHTNPNIG